MTNNFELPKVNFSVAGLQKIENSISLAVLESKNADLILAERIKIKAKIIKYVKQYYYEVSNGDYEFYNVTTDEFVHKDQKSFKKEVSDKLKMNNAFEQCFKLNNNIFSIVCDIHKPRIYKEGNNYYINSCRGFLHKKYKKFAKYSTEIQNNVQLILKMIKEISCNSDELLFEAYKKYLSCLCHGKKSEVIIYKKSCQGTGKSSETEFLMNYVLGKELCLISGTDPLLKEFNNIFMGKLLIIFEELPTFSISQWSVVSSKLKTLTTEAVTVYRGLYKDPIQANNISNFLINTNVDGLKDSGGRRIMIMPVSNCHVDDFEYFANIRNKCFNLEVGEAFYSYMMELDVSNFFCQRDFPESELKKIAISCHLNSVVKFIKFEYVLKKLPINKITPINLYAEYTSYCKSTTDLKQYGKNDFIKHLEDVNIEFKKMSGNNYYNYTYAELKKISDKNKWICAYDDEEEVDDIFDDANEIEDASVNLDYYKNKCSILTRRVQQLEMEANNKKKTFLDRNINDTDINDEEIVSLNV